MDRSMSDAAGPPNAIAQEIAAASRYAGMAREQFAQEISRALQREQFRKIADVRQAIVGNADLEALFREAVQDIVTYKLAGGELGFLAKVTDKYQNYEPLTMAIASGVDQALSSKLLGGSARSFADILATIRPYPVLVKNMPALVEGVVKRQLALGYFSFFASLVTAPQQLAEFHTVVVQAGKQAGVMAMPHQVLPPDNLGYRYCVAVQIADGGAQACADFNVDRGPNKVERIWSIIEWAAKTPLLGQKREIYLAAYLSLLRELSRDPQVPEQKRQVALMAYDDAKTQLERHGAAVSSNRQRSAPLHQRVVVSWQAAFAAPAA